MSGSFPMIRGDEQVEGWLSQFPEIDSRPDLLSAITRPGRRAKSFRGSFFKKMNMLYQVPFIPDDSVAVTVLRLAHQQAKEDLIEYWEGKIPNAAFCQSVSALKERYRRMLKEIRRRS